MGLLDSRWCFSAQVLSRTSFKDGKAKGDAARMHIEGPYHQVKCDQCRVTKALPAGSPQQPYKHDAVEQSTRPRLSVSHARICPNLDDTLLVASGGSNGLVRIQVVTPQRLKE